MCNCSKNRTSAARPRTAGGANTDTSGSGYVLVDSQGTRTQFNDKMAADAANAANGYTGIVKPVGG